MRMAKVTKIDLEYRPQSYWCTEHAVYANIKGRFRRESIAKAITEGTVDEIPPLIHGDSLLPAVRDVTGALHPSLMGGEYLPAYLKGEVEIARINLASTTGDVISIRARPSSRGIEYRVVDEYWDIGDFEYSWSPRSSRLPFPMRQMIKFLNSIVVEGVDRKAGIGYVQNFWEEQYGYGYNSLDECVSFATVESPFYPSVNEWYEEEGRRWKQRKKDEASEE